VSLLQILSTHTEPSYASRFHINAELTYAKADPSQDMDGLLTCLDEFNSVYPTLFAADSSYVSQLCSASPQDIPDYTFNILDYTIDSSNDTEVSCNYKIKN
jgi:hypothetical protein